MKDPATKEEARNILTFAVNAIKVVTVLLKPIIPSYCHKVEAMIGAPNLTWADANFDKSVLTNVEIGVFETLAQRLERGYFEKLIEASRESQSQPTPEPKSDVPEFKEEITIFILNFSS